MLLSVTPLIEPPAFMKATPLKVAAQLFGAPPSILRFLTFIVVPSFWTTAPLNAVAASTSTAVIVKPLPSSVQPSFTPMVVSVVQSATSDTVLVLSFVVNAHVVAAAAAPAMLATRPAVTARDAPRIVTRVEILLMSPSRLCGLMDRPNEAQCLAFVRLTSSTRRAIGNKYVRPRPRPIGHIWVI